MKRALLLILVISSFVLLTACAMIPSGVDASECFGYEFDLKVYDYYGDTYDDCEVVVTGKGGSTKTFQPENGLCKISLTRGEYTLTLNDNNGGESVEQTINVAVKGEKSFLEIETRFGYDRGRTADMLLSDKRKALVEEFGIFADGVVYEKDTVDPAASSFVMSEYFSGEGILTAGLNDLDGDGYNELLLSRISSSKLISQVYYVTDDELKVTEKLSTDLPMPYFGTCVSMKSYLMATDSGIDICTDLYYYNQYYSDGFTLNICSCRFENGKLVPRMTINGSGSAGVAYTLVTYKDGEESRSETVNVDMDNQDVTKLTSVLEGMGYPMLEAGDTAAEDAYLGGYGNKRSYYDHQSAIKLCKVTSDLVNSDHILGNESYVKYVMTDNTDTHALFGEAKESQEELDPYVLPAAYKEIIDLLISGKHSWKDEEIPGLPEVSYMYRYFDTLANVGYALIDIDNNGTDELFIGGGDPHYGFDIVDIYTLKNDKAVHLADSGERYIYHLNNDGTLYQPWSGGAGTSGTRWYKLDAAADKLIMTVDVYMDAPPAATDTSAYWFVSHTEDGSDKKSISQSEASSFEGSKDEKTISYRSFEEYNKTA